MLVAGASGAIGRQLVTALADAGARVVAAGRDASALEALETGAGVQTFDAIDADSCAAAVAGAADELGGLDLLVVAVGVAGFGPGVETDAAVSEELFAVNTLGPMSLVRAAAPYLADSEADGGGAAVVLSAILADLPTVGMADYSAAKSALATWLGVVRKENRRAFRVVDVRPPHLDTGLDQRALAGDPPKLPDAVPSADVVTAVLDAVRGKASEIVWDLKEKRLTAR